MSWSGCAGAALLAGSLLFTATAAAERPSSSSDATSSYRFAWVRGDGAEGCADERELEDGVRARLKRDPFDREATQSIEGDIAATAGLFRAKLRARSDAGTLVGHRELEVRASDCRTLTDALVLAIVLVIDPQASLSKTPETRSHTEPEPESDFGATPARMAVAHAASPSTPCSPSTQQELPAPVRPVERACPPCRPAECPPKQPPALAVQASLRALGAAGLLPNLAPGFGTNAALVFSRVHFAAGLSYFPEQVTGDFSFGLSAAHLGACVRTNPFGALTPSLCAQLQAGAMHAVVRELEPLRPGDHAWAAVGLGPELSIRPVGPLLVEASVLGLVPVVRPRFAVRGHAESVFQSSRLGGVVSVGVGIVAP